MIDAGILDGDRVIVKQQATAENGQIVCALIEGEATLKRFYKKDGVITLKAENENYPPITVSAARMFTSTANNVPTSMLVRRRPL